MKFLLLTDAAIAGLAASVVDCQSPDLLVYAVSLALEVREYRKAYGLLGASWLSTDQDGSK